MHIPSIHQFLVSRAATFLALSLTGTLLVSCAVNPATGQGNLVLMSENREQEIGREEHENVLSNMPVMDDEAINEYVSEVGQRLVDVSHRPDLDFTFTVIDSPEINAFALPGGYVYINRGLLTFLNSEDQLAAVLGHEIAHITARHAVQQHARGSLGSTAAGVGGFVAAVVTGNVYIGSELAQLGSVWTQAGVSGFGREHELEADGLSAHYLREAGYNPSAVIETVTILKNQEDFNVRVSGQRAGYHGLFATHPRNDVRLQQAVAEVGEVTDDQEFDTDPAVFRQHLEGMTFGQRSGDRGRNRYYQDTMNYTVVFPDGWSINETPSTVTASAPQQRARLRIETQRLSERKPPNRYLEENLGYTDLERTEALDQYRLRGYTGVRTDPENGVEERVAVLYMGGRAFVFRGTIVDGIEQEEELEELQQALLGSIRSFRAVQRQERSGNNRELNIHFVEVGNDFSWERLARQSPISQHAEDTLRLLNGYYPIGNPQPGDWVKVLR